MESDPQRTDVTVDPDGARACSERTYTLHINFTAVSDPHAELLGVRLAEGLGRLRMEGETSSARLSSAINPGHGRPLFCGAVGPDGERCADEPEHGGWHVEGCVNGAAWSDNEPRTVRIR